MAEFCEDCSQEIFGEESDFKGIQTKEDTDNGIATWVLCEGCGMILVDHLGKCINKDCLNIEQSRHNTKINKQ